MLKNKYTMWLLYTMSFSLLMVSNTIAQTSIGKRTVASEDVILDFKENDARGIVLPWVDQQSSVSDVVGGTLIFDAQDKKVKYYQSGTQASWIDLSIKPGAVDAQIQQGLVEDPTAQPTVLGNTNTTTKGVVVLEANDKAMVLPVMESPHLNLVSPAPGTLVFDSVSKMLCVYNGSEWAFWKIKK